VKIRGAGSVLLAVATVVAVGVIGYGVTALGNPPVKHAGQTPGYAPPPPPQYALMWGDSYFNGAAGVQSYNTLAAVAAADLGFHPIIAGHGGTGYVAANPDDKTPPYGQQILSGALTGISASVRVVVIEGGLNDASAPAGKIRAAAREVDAQFEAAFPKARIIALGPVDPTGGLRSDIPVCSDAIKAAAGAAGVPFIDATGWVTPANVATVIGPDNTHPTAAGHKVLGADLAAALKRLGVKPALSS
jgi:hypothetical protein